MVSDQLLSYVSGHVFSSRRHQLATHELQLKETLYQNIERDARSESERNAAVSYDITTSYDCIYDIANTLRHFYRPHSEGMGKVMFSHDRCLSAHKGRGGGSIPSPFHNIHPTILPSTGPMSFMEGGLVPQCLIPCPSLKGGGLDEVPPVRDWMGVPLKDWMGVPPCQGLYWGILSQDSLPETEQQNEYLLCSRWYASCIHRGGHSCFLFLSTFWEKLTKL